MTEIPQSGPESSQKGPRYRVVDLQSLPPVACPCGTARRAFADEPGYPGTIHLTEISVDARRHYHESLTETYFILDCEPGALLELDDDTIVVRPGMCILIPPRTRHRAVGRMKILNLVHPKFDPSDEILCEDD